jgi:dihydroorotate dehydrogenase
MNTYELLRPLLFLLPPEKAHAFAMEGFVGLLKIPGIKNIFKSIYRQEDLFEAKNMELVFRNRIGIAAGFDKNGLYTDALFALGFGHVEVGTVTPKPQDGNPLPRLFRLPSDKALINRMGFNNRGVTAMARSLEKRKEKGIVGGNIGKNKNTDNKDAYKDYVQCIHALHGLVDYFTVNISSPNTPGLRELQEEDALKDLLQKVQDANHAKSKALPLLLKIAPDMSKEAACKMADICIQQGVHGMIISNTTISREGLLTAASHIDSIGNGGLSGLPLLHASTDLLQAVHTHAGEKLLFIGSGGILSGTHMQKKFAAGASLVQVYTGFVYRGPGIVKHLYKELKTV